ncbi:MAG: biotin transporter BioY [Emcibacteraceae bacterium]|nr:biotin transporter BioY [Emcibacteraceae bacterium]
MSKNILFSLLFSILIVIGARVSLDIGPVPLTLQTAFIFMAALLLPMPYSILSVAIYLVTGAIGLPVFADGKSGFEIFTGPTGGFLIGFLLANIAISYLSRNTRYNVKGLDGGKIYWNAFLPCLAGSIVIQVCGMIWGKVYTGDAWGHIYNVWFAPFYFNMIFKMFIASLFSVEIWKYFYYRKEFLIR